VSLATFDAAAFVGTDFLEFAEREAAPVIDFRTIQPVKVTEDGTEIFTFPHDADSSYDVYVKERTIAIKMITHKTGVNKHSGKTWDRWKAEHTTIFSLKKERNGKAYLRVYKTTPRTRQRRGSFQDHSLDFTLSSNMEQLYWGKRTSNKPSMFSGLMDKNSYRYASKTSEAFALWKLVQIYRKLNPDVSLDEVSPANIIQYMAYPGLHFFTQLKFDGTFGNPLGHSLRWGTKIWLNEATDVRGFIQSAYGKEAVRKDVIRALAQCPNLYAISICQALKGLIPADWLVKLLQESDQYLITNPAHGGTAYAFSTTPIYVQLRRLLKLASLNQRKRLIFTTSESQSLRESGFLFEALSIMRSITNTHLRDEFHRVDFTSIRTLHDTLSVIQREQAIAAVDIPQKGLLKELDGAMFTADDTVYTMRSPKLNRELITWGADMSNCIASYANMVVAHHTHVFSVHNPEGTMVGNMEVSTDGVIRQFVGKFNGRLPEPMNLAATELVTATHMKMVKEAAKRKRQAKKKAESAVVAAA
jgi:hypothetical protein